jgi:HD-GYP domain-containing protein (c-di-GMP phosphodiesterase class II)
MNIPLEHVIRMLEEIADLHNIDFFHGSRVSDIAVAIGKRLNGGDRLDEEKIKLLEYAARVHDVGRVGVDNSIIAKAGKLTQSQRASMQEHSQIGYDLVKDALPVEISLTVLHTHENWDGTGYPKGLKGLDIPLFARIVHIADDYDGIVSERPYHRAHLASAALNEMEKNLTHYDPRLFAAFLHVLREIR